MLEGGPARPAGEYAAYLVGEKFGGYRVSTGGAYQVQDAQGQRIQVHGRHVRGREPKHFQVSLRLDERDFDAYVPVLFNEDYSLRRAWRLSWETLKTYASRYSGTGWRLHTTGPWREDPAVEQLVLPDPYR